MGSSQKMWVFLQDILWVLLGRPISKDWLLVEVDGVDLLQFGLRGVHGRPQRVADGLLHDAAVKKPQHGRVEVVLKAKFHLLKLLALCLLLLF